MGPSKANGPSANSGTAATAATTIKTRFGDGVADDETTTAALTRADVANATNPAPVARKSVMSFITEQRAI